MARDNRGVLSWAELNEAAKANRSNAAIPQLLEVLDPTSYEIRVVDPKTGGAKGSKIAMFSLIPPEFTWALAVHYGVGCKKYSAKNWELGYRWSLSVDALERHLNLFKQGEWLDQETGSPHIIAAAWHCVALFIFKIRGLGTNDLYKETGNSTE